MLFRSQYYRYTHGPYDPNLDKYIEVLTSNSWFKHKYSGADILVKGQKHADFSENHSGSFAKFESEIDKLIDFIKPMKTSQVERIATLFAAWNDFILDGISDPTDDQIITEVMTNWTPNKANTQRETWQGTLKKMRKNGITPKGVGLHTKSAQ